MVKRSLVELKHGTGYNVDIPIPINGRFRGDPTKIFGVILDRAEQAVYRTGVKSEIVSKRYSTNEFDLCPQHLLTNSDVNTESAVPLREAFKTTYSSGQGFFRCGCS